MSNLFPSPEHRALLLSTLKLIGAKQVVVHFSGGGDSGEIDNAQVLDAQDNTIDCDKHKLKWEIPKSVLLGEKWEYQIEETELPLSEILVKLTEHALEESGHDWYNNEGGQGHLRIDFSTSPPTIELNVGINTMTTEYHSYAYTDEPDEETN